MGSVAASRPSGGEPTQCSEEHRAGQVTFLAVTARADSSFLFHTLYSEKSSDVQRKLADWG